MVRIKHLPHNEEIVAINVPWLHEFFCILKHNLGVASEIRIHDSSLEITTASCGVVRDAS